MWLGYMQKFYISSSDMATTYHLRPCMPGIPTHPGILPFHSHACLLSSSVHMLTMLVMSLNFSEPAAQRTPPLSIHLWLSPSSLHRITQLSSSGCQSLELAGSEAMVSYARTLVQNPYPSDIYWSTSSTSFRGWLQRSLFGLAFGGLAGTSVVWFLIDLNVKLTTGWQF